MTLQFIATTATVPKAGWDIVRMNAHKQSRTQQTELTVSQAAAFYNRSEPTIRRWCNDGLLIKVGCSLKKDVTGRWLIILPSEA
jgi:hypothetical protein